ncbi:OmpA family protein, partial [Frankia sp. R82]|uniref:OmpA family protein n=1 Tax=Frankia sp. R82 TaxID=2950553 RepID=UPI00204394F4
AKAARAADPAGADPAADPAGTARGNGRVDVRGQITIDPKVGEPPLGVVPALAAALRGVPGDHSMALRGSTVELTGRVADPAAGRQLESTALRAARSSVPGVTVQNHLSLPSSTGTSATGMSAGSVDVGEQSRVLAAVRTALGARGITFPVSGATLNPAVRAGLDRAAEELRANDVVVLVGGYTDSTGPSTVNQALSLQRAEAVADYLVGRGVPRERLQAAGFGAQEPVGNNGTRAGRAANRRVQIMAAPTP